MLPAQMPAAAPEVVGLASAIVDIVVAAKAGSSALADAEAALPDLVAALAAIQNIGVDMVQAHNQAYILWAIGQAFETP